MVSTTSNGVRPNIGRVTNPLYQKHFHMHDICTMLDSKIPFVDLCCTVYLIHPLETEKESW